MTKLLRRLMIIRNHGDARQAFQDQESWKSFSDCMAQPHSFPDTFSSLEEYQRVIDGLCWLLPWSEGILKSLHPLERYARGMLPASAVPEAVEEFAASVIGCCEDLLLEPVRLLSQSDDLLEQKQAVFNGLEAKCQQLDLQKISQHEDLVALQGRIKEKEKSLAALQEQLDLLKRGLASARAEEQKLVSELEAVRKESELLKKNDSEMLEELQAMKYRCEQLEAELQHHRKRLQADTLLQEVQGVLARSDDFTSGDLLQTLRTS